MNNIEEKIKDLIWNHALKIIFIFGFVVGFVIRGLF